MVKLAEKYLLIEDNLESISLIINIQVKNLKLLKVKIQKKEEEFTKIEN